VSPIGRTHPTDFNWPEAFRIDCNILYSPRQTADNAQVGNTTCVMLSVVRPSPAKRFSRQSGIKFIRLRCTRHQPQVGPHFVC
jgi:hypothetical protein